MEERLAMIVKSTDELQDKLKDFIECKDQPIDFFRGPIFRGRAKHNNETISAISSDDDMAKIVNTWINKGKYEKLLDLWVKGLSFDWNKLYPDTKPRRTSLPTYPFSKERYWIPESGKENQESGIYGYASKLHPLLHQNTSDFTEQRFSSIFDGQEFFLSDHKVNGHRVMPGVAYLEMARAAAYRAEGFAEESKSTVQLKNVVWIRPFSVGDQPEQLHIVLFPEKSGETTYEIYSESKETDAEVVVHCQGRALLISNRDISAIDIKTLKAECNESKLSGIECYECFKTIGLDYGKGHQGIEKVYIGQDQVLAKLCLPSKVSDTAGEFTLHPSLMDSALQATIGLMIDANGPDSKTPNKTPNKPALPFALQELEVINKCPSTMWAFIRYSHGSTKEDKVQKLDIDLSDENGTVCVRMKGFSSRISVNQEKDPETLILKQSFKEQSSYLSTTNPATTNPATTNPATANPATTDPANASPEYIKHIVMLCEPDKVLLECIESELPGVNCTLLQTAQQNISERFQTYATQTFEKIQTILNDRPKGNVLLQVVVPCAEEKQLLSGLSGLLKTARIENPKLICQLIELDGNADSISEKLKENSKYPGDNQIRYQNDKRLVPEWIELETSQSKIRSKIRSKSKSKIKSKIRTNTIPWKEKGVYLITGGAGSLGLIFAEEITQHVKDTTLILTGRSKLNEEKQSQLKNLEKTTNAKIEYHQVDVTQEKAVYTLIQNIKDNYDGLNGIIHSAGLIRDNFIIKKTTEELHAVLAPKVHGLVNLDQASSYTQLDFFVIFSSIAGAFGNSGQADYACANAFMDEFAHYRNTLVQSTKRYGKTLSVNWPLWKEGGMHVDQDTEKIMMQKTGMMAMGTKTGITALYQGISSDENQIIVMEGDRSRLKQLFTMKPPVIPDSNNSHDREITTNHEKLNRSRTDNDGVFPIKKDLVKMVPEITLDLLPDKAERYLKKQLSSVLKLPVHRIESHAPMEDYGIDSVMVAQLTNELENTFGPLSKTLFFEYQTIAELTEYFIESYSLQLSNLLSIESNTSVTVNNIKQFKADPFKFSMVQSSMVKSSMRRRSRFSSINVEARKEETKNLDIAIIGLSGRYPKAENIDQFWQNLRNGRDCITEIPKDRWDYSLYYDEEKNRPNNKPGIKPGNKSGKINSKWGGFIDNVDKFDPLFLTFHPLKL